MKHASFPLIPRFVLMFALTPLLRAQSPQAPPPPNMHDQMMQMHQREMDSMKADIDKMKLSLAQMKANIPQIRDSTEKTLWQSNVDLWEVMLSHMENMAEHMQGMGIGHGMGDKKDHAGTHDHAAPPPADKKPE